VIEHWHRLPGEAIEFASLEILKSCLDIAQGNLLQLVLIRYFSSMVLDKTAGVPSKAQIFCDSVIKVLRKIKVLRETAVQIIYWSTRLLLSKYNTECIFSFSSVVNFLIYSHFQRTHKKLAFTSITEKQSKTVCLCLKKL